MKTLYQNLSMLGKTRYIFNFTFTYSARTINSWGMKDFVAIKEFNE